MQHRDKYYGGGKRVVYSARMTATTDTITVTLVANMCPTPPITAPSPQAANMKWYPSGTGFFINESDPGGTLDADF